MSPINTVTGLASTATLRDFVSDVTSRRSKTTPDETGDRVEFSELGRLLQDLSGLPDVRVQKVAEVRAAIRRGDYETPDKLDQAVERFMDDVGAAEV